MDFSDEEFFDANDEVPSELTTDQCLEVMSPSISIITFEGDPPEIEEDKDYHEINNVEGMWILDGKSPGDLNLLVTCILLLLFLLFCLFLFYTTGLVTSNRSMIIRLLSQIRIGMDLTRIVLPAFIFEKRSLLEMYAEFFSHPDLIIR